MEGAGGFVLPFGEIGNVALHGVASGNTVSRARVVVSARFFAVT
jgi:hypothetical protein